MANQVKPLFSDYYLTQRLGNTLEWNEDISPCFDRLKSFYQEKQAILTNLNESQTEDEWIKPIFELLGFSYIVQTNVRKSGKVQRPDYGLFLDEKSKGEAYNLREDETAFYSKIVAIADAKYWERPLSESHKNDPRDSYKNSNPSFQIINYLDGTRVDWGILTNGRVWRLYYRLSASPIQQFYEVDLVDIVVTNNVEKFKYFWLFFRKEAFIKDQYNRNFLERVREESTNYAREVGGELKSLVFNQVFASLAGGFLPSFLRDNGGDIEDHTSAIYQATLSFLYKILFLLYAESKSLLPISQDSYREYSLSNLSQEIAPKIDKQQVFSQTSSQYYDRLLGLFRIIDLGDVSLNVPAYNGGLFKVTGDNISGANRFLLQYKLSDAVLAPVLDQLARIKGERIDYKFLGVRDLGSIYEGLLEYKLVIEDVATGKVHLENDKGERRETGSYYTPEYIVDYIVQHTLDPILEERGQLFGELMQQIETLRHDLQDCRKSNQTIKLLRKDLAQLEYQARETLLDIKVCDPAMGSGHFLVTTVDYITRKLVKILDLYPNHNPILEQLERIKEEIISHLTQQGIEIDSDKLSPDNLLHRAVMKRCIYGVDLNPMAVELAKVSLWLHSFTVGAPLSFLDHHLRCGNSLIGCMAKDVQDEYLKADQSEGYLPLFQTPFHGLLQSANVMLEIANLSDATFAQVEQSQQYYYSFAEQAKPYKQLLDVYIGQYFGLKRKEIDSFFRFRLQDLKGKVNKKDQRLVDTARQLYQDKRFFHWDLEFPEVFIDLASANWKENAGFDVVLGNPPYINVLNIEETERKYLLNNYKTAIGRVDVYIPYFEKTLLILKTGGLLGLITPNKYFVYGYGQALRKKLLTETCILTLIDLARVPSIFPEAATYTVISIIAKITPLEDQQIKGICFLDDIPELIQKLDNKEISESVSINNILQNIFTQTPVNVLSLSLDNLRWSIYQKVFQKSKMIERIFKLEQCIRIGNKKIREELIIKNDNIEQLSELAKTKVKKIIDAEELEKYYINWQGRYLIYDRDRLYNAKSEKLFQQPKIFIKDASLYLRVAVDSSIDDPFFALNTAYLLVPLEETALDIHFVATLLNSPVSDFLYKLLFGALTIRGGYIRFREYLQYLPIRKINFTTPEEIRKEAVNQLIEIYNNQVEQASSLLPQTNKQDAYSTMIQDHLESDRTDIIHDFLAYLAQKMIELNKAKQEEIKGFLTWLSREIGTDINNLTNKTALKNYLGDYQKQEQHLTLEKLLVILKKNKKKLNIDTSSRQFQTLLENEYQTSLNTLLPLKQQLSYTDTLIDQIVYQLYGLTPEEIAIIEGKN